MSIIKFKGLLKSYVMTECDDCLLSITGMVEKDKWAGEIYIGEMSGHARDYDLSLYGRLRNAWMALRGCPVEAISIDSPATLKRLTKALYATSKKVWTKDSMWRKKKQEGKP